MYDLVLLTDQRYLEDRAGDWYINNIIKEDEIVTMALEKLGICVWRTNWDNPSFNWSHTRSAMFRTTWDYFNRFEEFDQWLKRTSFQTQFMNSCDLVKWNIDKHYLEILRGKGINIPPTLFIEKGARSSLESFAVNSDWKEFILKPAISGSARHTYRFTLNGVGDLEQLFSELISRESMLLQEYQFQITTKGEVALMVMDGEFTHAILKKAKAGDFRVQDDFGGTVHDYSATSEEIKFAEEVVACCPQKPVYARVDIIRDNSDKICLCELEIIEPELWFRNYPPSADVLAKGIKRRLSVIS